MRFHWTSYFVYSGLVFAAGAPTYPSLTYSTYLRSGFTPSAIATDSAGNIYLAGNLSVNPPTVQTTVMVMKLNPQASDYLYVRYLGGSEATRRAPSRWTARATLISQVWPARPIFR